MMGSRISDQSGATAPKIQLSQRVTYPLNQSVIHNGVLEQPLASPGSAKYVTPQYPGEDGEEGYISCLPAVEATASLNCTGQSGKYLHH